MGKFVSMYGGSNMETDALLKKCEQCGEQSIPREAVNRYCDECETLRTITRLSARVRELEGSLFLVSGDLARTFRALGRLIRLFEVRVDTSKTLDGACEPCGGNPSPGRANFRCAWHYARGVYGVVQVPAYAPVPTEANR